MDQFKPYVPEKTDLKELTLKALLLGVLMAVILGAANAYLGLKAGLTVAATFPAAVVAMAALRIFKGSILEENIARTTASVGEALAAGAIFTIPAFVMTGVWQEIKYFESSILMLIGGLLGVLFVTISRRALIRETDLPFPESVACAEIIKAGQKGASGAKYVFSTLGLSALIEFLRSDSGLHLFKEPATKVLGLSAANIDIGLGFGKGLSYKSAMFFQSPALSPAIMGVGYIIGPRLAALVFSGGVFAWFLLVPLALLFNSELVAQASAGGTEWVTLGTAVWYKMIRPLAVGAMVVGAFYTLFKLRKPLTTGIGRALKDMRTSAGSSDEIERTDKDIKFNWLAAGVILLMIPLFVIYFYYTKSVFGALVSTIVMAIAGFLFAAIAGYLIGLIGSSNNPISGLTLSTLLIAALLMVAMGLKGNAGIAAVLGIAAVVCCVAGIGGDMMQDLKVGHILGGTPWKMEVAELTGVVITAFVMAIPLALLHKAFVIGSPALSAPQAGLMALMAKGIVGGEMAWSLVIIGMFFAVGLILLKTPSVMIVAVGMYLPFSITFAIFVGGLIKWLLDMYLERKKTPKDDLQKAENNGILLASGLVAGESLMGIALAIFVVSNIADKIPKIGLPSWTVSLVFLFLAFVLIYFPLKAIKNAKSS